MTNEEQITHLRIGERENGYMQCYNDLLLVLLDFQEAYPFRNSAPAKFIASKMELQMEIRKVTGWSHPEEIAKSSND